MPSQYAVTVTPPNTASGVTLTSVSGLQASWEVNRAGTLTWRVPVRDLLEAELPADLNGRWVRWDHPTAGAWAGVVTMTAVADGIADVSAQSFHILARRRLTDRLLDGTGITSGLAMKRAVESVFGGRNDQGNPTAGDAGAVINNLLRLEYKVDPDNPKKWFPVGFQVDGGGQDNWDLKLRDLYDEVIPSLTDDIGWQWSVDADRYVRYGESLGTDRSAGTVLAEGREVVSAKWQRDSSVVINTVVVRYSKETNVGTKKKPKIRYDPAFAGNPTTPAVEASIAQYGKLQAYYEFPNVTTEQLAKRRAARIAGQYLQPWAALTLEVADVDGAWAKFREGDTVRVEVGGWSAFSGKVLVRARALDAERGVMTVAGDQVPTS